MLQEDSLTHTLTLLPWNGELGLDGREVGVVPIDKKNSRVGYHLIVNLHHHKTGRSGYRSDIRGGAGDPRSNPRPV